MPSRFAETLRSLEAERARSAWILPALALALAWAAWLAWAEVSLYATTSRARLEVSRMASHVMTSEGGRVLSSRCTLGHMVTRGDVLVELDASSERGLIARKRAELEGTERKLTALREQIRVERGKLGLRERLDLLATRRAHVGLAQARGASELRRELSDVKQGLEESGYVARVEVLTAAAERDDSRLKVDDLAVEIERLDALRAYELASESARLSELGRALAELEAEHGVEQAELAALLTKLEQRKVVAPASGRLGHVQPLKTGDVVASGAVLATVVPDDSLHVVAEFAPDEAAGHILPGMPARVRLTGFSWIEYGSADGTVLSVASEPHHDSIRVELALVSAARLTAPVQHGLPSQVDVKVATVSPLRLLLRTLGKVVGRPAHVPQPAYLSAAEPGS